MTLDSSRRASMEGVMPHYPNTHQDQFNALPHHQQQMYDGATRGSTGSIPASLGNLTNERKDTREKDKDNRDSRERKDERESGAGTTSGPSRLSGAVRSNQVQVQDPSFTFVESNGAKRLTRPPQSIKDVPQPATRGEKIIKVETTSALEQEPIYSIETLKVMCDDQHWVNRLKGFEVISGVLSRTIAFKNKDDDGVDLRPKDSRECFNTSVANIECIVDVAVNHLGDSHQKVAVEAMSVLSTCVQGYTPQTLVKLGVLLTALFNRLADRRAQIK